MKIEKQEAGYWLAEQKLSNGRLLLCEGDTRQEASRRMHDMIYQKSMPAPPRIDVEEVSMALDNFNKLFRR